MNPQLIKKHLFNCFLLMLPVIAWNIALTPFLPAAYQPDTFGKSIPAWLTYSENCSRVVVFLLTFLMPLAVTDRKQRKGVYLYVAGLLLYFASWIVLIVFPESAWNKSLAGFLAPAWTPLFWLAGIACIGNAFYFRLPYRSWYFMIAALLFLVFHNAHTILVYFNTR